MVTTFFLGQSPRNMSGVGSYTGEDITEVVDGNNNNEDVENDCGDASGTSQNGLFSSPYLPVQVYQHIEWLVMIHLTGILQMMENQTMGETLTFLKMIQIRIHHPHR